LRDRRGSARQGEQAGWPSTKNSGDRASCSPDEGPGKQNPGKTKKKTPHPTTKPLGRLSSGAAIQRTNFGGDSLPSTVCPRAVFYRPVFCPAGSGLNDFFHPSSTHIGWGGRGWGHSRRFSKPRGEPFSPITQRGGAPRGSEFWEKKGPPGTGQPIMWGGDGVTGGRQQDPRAGGKGTNRQQAGRY